MRIHFVLVGVLLLGGVACQRRAAQSNDKADIEHAIQEYVSKRPGLSAEAMVTEVRQVTFQGDTAEADVLFRSRSNPDASMTMRYTLKRTGPNSWAVQGPKSSAGSHGMPRAGSGAASPHGQPEAGAPISNPHGAPAEGATPQAAPAPAHPPAGSPGRQSSPSRPKP